MPLEGTQFDFYGLSVALLSRILHIHHWDLSIHILPVIWVFLSVFLFYLFYRSIAGNSTIALYSIIGFLLFVVVSFEQRGERLGEYFLVRIAEDKGFLWMIGTPLYGWLSIRTLQKRKWYLYGLLSCVSLFLGFMHPLSVFWLGPVFLFAILPFAILHGERPAASLITSGLALAAGIIAGSAIYVVLKDDPRASFDTIVDFTRFLQRNMLYIIDRNVFMVHPRFLSDRFTITTLMLLPVLLLKFDRKNTAHYYALITTFVFLIILFVPPFPSLLARFTSAGKLDRMLWNLPLPLVFGIGVSHLLPYLEEFIHSVKVGRLIKTSCALLFVLVSIHFFLTPTAIGRFRRIFQPQKVTVQERQVYDFIVGLDPPKGQRVWAPLRINQFLPAFCYGVYPFEFRGVFDRRLDVSDSMGYVGKDNPVYRFYDAEAFPDIDRMAILLKYTPDYIVLTDDSGVSDTLADILKDGQIFKNDRYGVYRLDWPSR